MAELDTTYDYIIIGSGPGGATVTKELADGTRRVLLVESGPRLTGTGVLATRRAFFAQDGTMIKSDGGISIGRGRVLGGASYVAMGNAPTPPTSILQEWGVDLSMELEDARSDLRVQPMPSELMGDATRRINEGALSLGWEMKPTPKCVDFGKCKACGLCMFGCPTKAKWTALELVDAAVANGADLLLETEATRVLTRDGRAVGVEAVHKGSKIEIRGDTVIVSAGALETPRILQNTGIRDAGKGLALDVFQSTYGYTQDIGMQNEPILATYLEAHIEEKELFAAPYMYAPYTLARSTDGNAPARLSLPFEVKTLVRSKLLRANRLIGMMTKIRDEMMGEVLNDGTIRKTLTGRDHEKLEEAHEINKQILVAAGADPDTIFRGAYESGHPCCTAAIGRVVDEDQETEIKGLFVSDASVFPSPLGMPPILTIVALSKRLARHLLS